MRLIQSFVALCGLIFSSALFGHQAAATPLDDSTLADQALAIIGARVPNSSNKCAGCHHLDAAKLRTWMTLSAHVANDCLTPFTSLKTVDAADRALACLSVNHAPPYSYHPRGLGLWAARVKSEDFRELFTTKYAKKADQELNRFRQASFMPRNGTPGFTDDQWSLVKEYFDRGAPLLEEKLTPHSAPGTPTPVEDLVLLDDLKSPWAVTASPDGQVWITEREGTIQILDGNYKRVQTLKGFEDLVVVGQGGLLDLAFHPQYPQNKWIYVTYTVERNGGYNTQVNRYTVRDGVLVERKMILDGPTGTDGAHFGGRLVFDDEGLLYASFGERHQKEKAQDPNTLNGKVVRLYEDGTVPEDNPFGLTNPVYTLGHRNPQGLAIHPLSRALVDSEHGPTGYDAPGGGDEVNVLTAGANYGWPVIHHRLTQEGMQSPLAEWTPSIAPSGIVFYTGRKIPQWKNDLFVAALAGEALFRLTIDANGVLSNTEKLLEGKYGRLRDVGNAPDGTLLVLSESGQLIQIRPK